MKITGIACGEIQEKRFYLPGVEITDNCPECGSLNEYDLEGHYLSYPPIGTPFDFNFCCIKCEFEWSCKVKLNVQLEPCDG